MREVVSGLVGIGYAKNSVVKLNLRSQEAHDRDFWFYKKRQRGLCLKCLLWQKRKKRPTTEISLFEETSKRGSN